MNPMNVLVLCRDGLRHKYFAIRLMKEFGGAVIFETREGETADVYSKAPSELMRRHFEEFDEAERKYFQEYVEKNGQFLGSMVALKIPFNTINENVEYIKRMNPKVIAVYGTSLIEKELISFFPKRILGIHAGLSPHYKGSGTNIFPFYNNELDKVGMTVQFIDEGIDTGEIIYQDRPEFEKGDNTHTIGCKCVVVGTDLMVKAVRGLLKDGNLPSKKQDTSKGKTYYKKDFTDEVILKIRKNIKGMVERHVEDKNSN